jgi:hypothetical protein
MLEPRSSLGNGSGLYGKIKLLTEKFPTGSRTSHLDAHTSMEHAHPRHAHIVLQMSLTLWVKNQPTFYAHILHQCLVSSLWAEPTTGDHLVLSVCKQTEYRYFGGTLIGKP